MVVVASDETRDKLRRRIRGVWVAKRRRRTRAGVLKAMRAWAARGRRLGRSAVPGWLEHAGLRHFGSWPAAVEAAVGDCRAHSHFKYRTREDVCGDIRALAARGVDLTPSAVARERPALYDAGTRLYPWSWRKALKAAGVDPARYPNPSRRWDLEKARAWVRRAARRGPVHAKAVPVSLYQFVRYRLGRSWPAWVGEVAGVVSFGAFVRFGDGLEGLIHISEIDWQLITNPADVLKSGERVRVKIIGIEGDKVSLSLKAMKEDPWSRAEEKYKKGGVVMGTVVKFNPFGVFVKLDPEIQGLVHISEFGSEANMKETLRLNEPHEFTILSVDAREHRLALGLAREEPQPSAEGAAIPESESTEPPGP